MVNHPKRSRAPRKLSSPTADQVRMKRKEQGLSQREAAALIDGTERSWQAYEAGERTMPTGYWRLFLSRIAYKTLDMATVDELLAEAA